MIRGLGRLAMVVTLSTAAGFTMPPSQRADSSSAQGPAPGIPLSLAEERAHRISDLRYDLHFSIPVEENRPVDGRAVITFVLKDAARPLALDFVLNNLNKLNMGVRSVRVGSKTIVPTIVPDHLVIPAEHLQAGRNEIAIEFVAGGAALNRQPEFLYTLFVPARAHLTFPCFDQPDLKARWTLSLDLPGTWQAVANGAETARNESGGRLRLAFAETEPLPTYLFAFAAGRFSVDTAERQGRTFRMFHRETDADKVARNRDAIFDLHASAIAWLERYTASTYPWGKFDFLLVPSFQFGGMEHAGAIFYNASALLLDPSATQNQKLGRASLIAHETAHMWFGDLVTMRWFNDVWMKEVFANFMAAKIVNPSFPDINHDLRFLVAHYPAAYEIDRTPGTNAIRQPLDNLNEAGSLYGAIIYQKAPIVMRQLEGILGEAALRDGLQHYLRAHRFGNATWADLVALLDERTPQDLAAWSRAWVEEAGRPIVTTELRVDDGRITSLSFVQRDPFERRGLTWDQRLDVTLGLPDGLRTLPVRLAAARVEVPDARGLPAPRFVLSSGGGVGYAAFALDPTSLDYLLAHLPDIDDPLTRGAAWITLWEQMLDRRTSASAIVELALRALPRETDEQNVQRILGYARQAYWMFLSEVDRRRVSPRIEQVLTAGLAAAPTPSLKSAWFAAFRDVAESEGAVSRLERVWRKTEQVPGLTLAEPDYIALALELAVREPTAPAGRSVPRGNWKAILDEQLERIENPDRKARFAYVRPALSADEGVRDTFFERLHEVAFRQREAWVLEGLSYLHHPLRAKASEKFIPASLALLREIQRTGDIFFPKRWMDATLGGHSSATAARMVARFLAELPEDYPDRLRRVILSSSDNLFRASGTRALITSGVER
jgi:aminopeptidase N